MRSKSRSQKGYVLLSIMLMVTLMLIALAVEAPRIAQQIKREKEEELIHRGNEYKNAIKKYFRKFGRYPMNVEQLENTNNMRFLRKRYKDPFTGKDEWRLLHPGEVQINALNQGLNAPSQPGIQSGGNIGIAAPNTSGPGIATNTPTSGITAPGTIGQPQSGPTQGITGPTTGPTIAGGQGANPPGTAGFASTPSTTGAQLGGGPIIGVASTNKSESIKEINGKNHYNEGYFVYDPRLEQQNLPPGAPGTGGTNNPVGGNTPGLIGPTQTQPGSNTPNQMSPPRIQQ